MNREPISSDDPDLTAYALGELTTSERREFEAKLEMSPNASSELESMDQIMSLLSKGLKNEWATESNEPALEVLQPIEVEDKIVPFSFRRSKKVIGTVAAAAAAVALFVGSQVSFQSVPTNEVVSDEPTVSEEIFVASLDSAAGVHVPRLVVANEPQDIGSMSLSEAIDNLETLEAPVDASYLESNTVVPAGLQVNDASNGAIPAGFSRRSSDRVDSYLPPVAGQSALKTGLIERRVKNSGDSTRIPVGTSSHVFVRGFVSLDNVAKSVQNRAGQVLQGFQPVSMSANPVRSSEDDLKLMAELQTIQQELLSVAHQLPEESTERAKLTALLERNRSAIGGLKAQLAR